MAANEDYLDSLLKAAMDSEKKDDPNRPLTPEEIDAMFASAEASAEASTGSDVEASIALDTASDAESSIETNEESDTESSVETNEESGIEASADDYKNVETIGTTEPVQSESIVDNKILEDTLDDSATPVAELLSGFDSIEDLDVEAHHAQSQPEPFEQQIEQQEQFEQPEQSEEQIEQSGQIKQPEQSEQQIEQTEQLEQPEQSEQQIEQSEQIEQFDQPEQPEGNASEKDSHSEMEFDLDSMDDIDELLGLKEMPENYKEDRKDGASDQIAENTDSGKNELEETDLENQDLADLLDLLGGDNDDLAEINDILKKSDNNEIVDNASIQELENAMSADPADATSKDEEDAGKEKKKGNKKKKRLFGRKKKKDDTIDDADSVDGEEIADENADHENIELDDIAADFEALSGGAEFMDADDAAKSEKKKEKNGFFKKLIQVLTEEIDDEPEATEDPDAPKKKEKKDKKGKKKKSAETNEELLEEMAEEDEKAIKEKKKQKKPKKEKKKKEKIKIEDAGAPDEKKLPKKMVVRIFVLGFSILAVVIILAIFTPKIISLQKAHSLFYKGDYKNAYKELITQGSLGESDKVLLEKAELLTELDNKNSLYQAYSAADMALEGVNALLDGIDCYQKNIDRYAQYGISYEAEIFYEKFMTELSGKYGLTAEQVNEILQMDSVAYTYKLREITNTTRQSQTPVSGENPAMVSANDMQGGENPDQNVDSTSMADPLADELE